MNFTNRANNGFFLTSARDAPSDEKEMYVAAVAVATKGLYDAQIRGSNVLSKMKALDDLAADVEKSIEASGFDVGSTTAYAYMVLFACMSTYNEKMQRLALKKRTKSE